MNRTFTLNGAEIRVFPEAVALSHEAAHVFMNTSREAIRSRGRFTVALSGGSTPKAMYSVLAAEHHNTTQPLEWGKVHVFFSDERMVPSDHRDSNYRTADEALLTRVQIPRQNIHRIRTELDAPVAASEYEKQIRSVLGTSEKGIPCFDLILLGMGTDGHTASLFPESNALEEKSALVSSNWVAKLNSYRVTFTFPLINAASAVVFLAGGSDKAAMLRNVLRGDKSRGSYPAQRVRPNAGSLLWLVDQAAAEAL